jgi:hypothetical protein
VLSSRETANFASIDSRTSTDVSGNSDKIESLDIEISVEESTEIAQVSSIETRASTQESKQSTEVDSIDSRLQLEEATTTISLDIPVSGNASHLDVNFSSAGYSSNDTIIVYGALRDAADNANNPIIMPQISGANSHNSVTFIFSDSIPENQNSIIHDQNSDYVMDCIFKQENQN